MKRLNFFQIILITIFSGLFFVVGKTQAAFLEPLIGDNPNFPLSFTREVKIYFNKADDLIYGQDYYQLLIFKTGTGSVGSWAANCNNNQMRWSSTGSTSASLTLISYANIEPNQASTVAVHKGGSNVTFQASHDLENDPRMNVIGYQYTVSFDQDYDNAHLYYVLLHSLDPLERPTSDYTCTYIAEDEATKTLTRVGSENNSDSGGGGGTTTITIDDPKTKSFGTATVKGFSFAGLFGGGGSTLDLNTFPIINTLLTSLLYLAGFLLVITIIYSGIILIRSTSDEEAVKAKQNLLWALTGAFVIVIARWLVDTIIKFFF
ncbi:MAG: pilin [bacterium]|nr:pilin [bacterium]